MAFQPSVLAFLQRSLPPRTFSSRHQTPFSVHKAARLSFSSFSQVPAKESPASLPPSYWQGLFGPFLTVRESHWLADLQFLVRASDGPQVYSEDAFFGFRTVHAPRFRSRSFLPFQPRRPPAAASFVVLSVPLPLRYLVPALANIRLLSSGNVFECIYSPCFFSKFAFSKFRDPFP